MKDVIVLLSIMAAIRMAAMFIKASHKDKRIDTGNAVLKSFLYALCFWLYLLISDGVVMSFFYTMSFAISSFLLFFLFPHVYYVIEKNERADVDAVLISSTVEQLTFAVQILVFYHIVL